MLDPFGDRGGRTLLQRRHSQLVKWDGRYVAGISKVGLLKRSTEPVEHREGGDPSTVRKSPGQTKYEPITLERGVTHDTEFEKWANKIWNYGSGLGSEVSLADFRKDIIIEVYNEAGQVALAYKIFRCWVSEFQALPELDASARAKKLLYQYLPVLLQSLTALVDRRMYWYGSHSIHVQRPG